MYFEKVKIKELVAYLQTLPQDATIGSFNYFDDDLPFGYDNFRIGTSDSEGFIKGYCSEVCDYYIK